MMMMKAASLVEESNQNSIFSNRAGVVGSSMAVGRNTEVAEVLVYKP